MFPSSGYFRGFNCPYYLSGLCERPYCHYRHVKVAPAPPEPPPSAASVPVSIHSSFLKPAQTESDSTSHVPLRGKLLLPPPKSAAASSNSSTVAASEPTKHTIKSLPLPAAVSTPPRHRRSPRTEYDPIGSTEKSPATYVPTPLHILEEMHKRRGRHQHTYDDDDYDPMSSLSPPNYSPAPPPKTSPTVNKRHVTSHSASVYIPSSKVPRLSTNDEVIPLISDSDSAETTPEKEAGEQHSAVEKSEKSEKVTESGKLEKPTEPGKSEKPTEPGKSEKAVESGNPTEPGKPDKAAEPGKPEKAAESGKPEIPTESGKSVESFESEKPAENDKTNAHEASVDQNQLPDSDKKKKKKKKKKKHEDKEVMKLGSEIPESNDGDKSESVPQKKHKKHKKRKDSDSNITTDINSSSNMNVLPDNEIPSAVDDEVQKKHKKHHKKKKMSDAITTTNDTTEPSSVSLETANQSIKKKKHKKHKQTEKKGQKSDDVIVVKVEKNSPENTSDANKKPSVQLLYQDIFGDADPGVSNRDRPLFSSDEDDLEDEYDPMESSAPASAAAAVVVVQQEVEPLPPPPPPPPSRPRARLAAREACQLRHERLQSGQSQPATAGKVHVSTEQPKVKEFELVSVKQEIPDAVELVEDEEDEGYVPRPRVPIDLCSKVPMNIRQRYLEKMADESERLYKKKSEAYSRALHEEQLAYSKSANRTVYLNNVINSIKRLRCEKPGSSGIISSPGGVSHSLLIGEAALLGRGRISVDEDPVEGVALKELHRWLQPYLLSDNDLEQNGFPRPVDASVMDGPLAVRLPPAALERLRHDSVSDNSLNISGSDLVEDSSWLSRKQICVRCGSEFWLDEKGCHPADSPECCYHWGRAFKTRVPGAGVIATYTCCQEEAGGRGCQVAARHVHDTNRWADLSGYRKTGKHVESHEQVYALDCEMVYTCAGVELARVTVIDRGLEVVLDRLVRPSTTVVDYNTRFSGLTEQNMRAARLSLSELQDELCSLIDAEDILVGHSLESDLLSIRLVHNNVVDTSVVFPHRLGPPKKRALRNLASEILNKIIQSEDDSDELVGHDSKEDATVCMELMLHKVYEDIRKYRRMV